MVDITPWHAAIAVTSHFKPIDTRQKPGHDIGRVQTVSCTLHPSKYMLQRMNDLDSLFIA